MTIAKMPVNTDSQINMAVTDILSDNNAIILIISCNTKYIKHIINSEAYKNAKSDLLSHNIAGNSCAAILITKNMYPVINTGVISRCTVKNIIDNTINNIVHIIPVVFKCLFIFSS